MSVSVYEHEATFLDATSLIPQSLRLCRREGPEGGAGLFILELVLNHRKRVCMLWSEETVVESPDNAWGEGRGGREGGFL